ncbi:MAG: FAD-dependent oxidoreductase [Acidimicrobiales bacterium]
MSGIVVCGAGVCGLTSAMLLAKDGHDVTVLERDPTPPPPLPADAWDDWQRRGVNQFRLPHFLLPAFREVMEAELPEIITALLDAGAHRFNLLGPFADVMDPAGREVVVTARRPLVEAAVAKVAQDTPGVTIRRGVAVAGVVTDGGCPPRVLGVRTEEGQEVRADLVVDAGGRRSPMARWLRVAGARTPLVEEEDSGFVYYGRHVRAADGVDLGGPGMTMVGSVGLLVLPADDRISGIGIIAASNDTEMHALRHEGPWAAAMATLPGGQEVLDSEYVSPLTSMAAIEDRWRRYVVDGEPVAIGVVSVGDAWAATNPTLGRGISIGARHAVALRDVVRAVGVDPWAVTCEFDGVTTEKFSPWYRSTVWHDRHRLEGLEVARGACGATPESDVLWSEFRRFETTARQDPEHLLPRLLAWVHLAELPEVTVADPAVQARLDELGAEVPTADTSLRAPLVAAVAAAS